jgi:hypothetical protein
MKSKAELLDVFWQRTLDTSAINDDTVGGFIDAVSRDRIEACAVIAEGCIVRSEPWKIADEIRKLKP